MTELAGPYWQYRTGLNKSHELFSGSLEGGVGITDKQDEEAGSAWHEENLSNIDS